MTRLYFERYVPGVVVWLANRMAMSAGALYRDKFGISVTDWRVLAHFQLYPWSTATQAAELMGLDKATVGRSVAGLKDGGWLKSRPQGLRKIEYAPTAAGIKLHGKVMALASAREEALLEGFTPEQRERLIADLQKLVDNIDGVDRIGQ